MSADGSVVVGQGGGEAFLWTDLLGMMSVHALLQDLGVGSNVQGWTLTHATAVSTGGGAIAGVGINP